METKYFKVKLNKHTANSVTPIETSMAARDHYEVAAEMERLYSGEERVQWITDMVIEEIG